MTTTPQEPQPLTLTELMSDLQPVDVTMPSPDELGTDERQDALSKAHSEPGDPVLSTSAKSFVAFTSDDGNSVRTPIEAIRWARTQVRESTTGWQGMCLMFTRMCLGVDPLYPDAITAWLQAAVKYRKQARRAHAGFFRGGKHGHAVLVLDQSADPDEPFYVADYREARCISTDIAVAGQADVTTIGRIEAAWGYAFMGTTGDVNGVQAPESAPKRPRLRSPEWRLALVRKAYLKAQPGSIRRARLKVWMRQLQARVNKAERKGRK